MQAKPLVAITNVDGSYSETISALVRSVYTFHDTGNEGTFTPTQEGIMPPPMDAWTELATYLRLRTGAEPFDDQHVLGGSAEFLAALSRAQHKPAARGGRADADDDLLLCRRMRALHLDPDELYCSDPRAFSAMQRLCGNCDCPGRCAQDLGDEFADPGWQDWRNYCPNATTLSILSALQGCGPDEPIACDG